MINTELDTKEKCIQTIIKTCMANFDKLKEQVYLWNEVDPMEVIMLRLHNSDDIVLITESGSIARGYDKFANKLNMKSLYANEFSMEQIYECLKELVHRIS